MTVTVRGAQARDAAGIVSIWNPIIDDTAFTFTTARKTEDSIRGDIAARGGAFLVATERDAVVGFATYSQFRGGPGYAHTMEHSVILGPGARGRGVGRALMTALLDHARDAGVHSMWAGVSAENPAGVRFHAALGFAEIAALPEVGHKFGRWMDLVLMQKIL